MRVTVVGLIVGRDLLGRSCVGSMEEKFSTSVEDNRRLVTGPAWVGKPDFFFVLVSEGFEVCHLSLTWVEIGKIKNTSSNGLFKSLLIFETDLLFILGKTDAS